MAIIIMITVGECMALLGEPNELNIATVLYMFQLYIFVQYAMKCSYIVATSETFNHTNDDYIKQNGYHCWSPMFAI